jgi:parvulin-like peptidyl-prolyl isomerase
MLGFRLLPALLLVAIAPAADVRVLEQIVAKVNGDIITTNDLARYRKDLESDLRQRGLTGDALKKELAARDGDILRDRIDTLLEIQRAKEMGINVDSDVTKQLAELQRRAKIADQDQFHEAIRKELGMPFEDYRQQVLDGMLTQRLKEQEVYSKLVAPREELQKYYDGHLSEFIRQNRIFLSEILISTADKDAKEMPALEKKAKGLVERARNGERFSDLARDNSDHDSAANGGQLGAIAVDQLDPKIAGLTANQEKGYITDAIRIPDGWLILRVDDRQKAGQASFEEVQGDIVNVLLEPRADAATRVYLTELRKNAFLQIREGYVDTGAAPGLRTEWMNPTQLKPETVAKEEVANRVHRKRLLWLVPVPGTETSSVSTSASK